MAQIQGQVGIQQDGDGASPVIRMGRTGALAITDAHGRYYETSSRQNAYRLTTAAAASATIGAVTPTAYVGAAGGTPLVGLFNPSSSGKNVSILTASISQIVAASAAGDVAAAIFVGPSAAPTGTIVVPFNTYSGAQAGSVCQGVVNSAATSTTAVYLSTVLTTYYWATAAGAIYAPNFFDISGAIILTPGSFLGFGVNAAPASATWSAALTWEEVPV